MAVANAHERFPSASRAMRYLGITASRKPGHVATANQVYHAAMLHRRAVRSEPVAGPATGTASSGFIASEPQGE